MTTTFQEGKKYRAILVVNNDGRYWHVQRRTLFGWSDMDRHWYPNEERAREVLQSLEEPQIIYADPQI